MHLPEIDRYASLRSPLHSWDPRVKLVSISLLLVSIVLTDNLFVAAAGLLIAVVLVALSRIPFRFVFIHLRWVLIFILFFFIVMPLTVPGEKSFRLLFLNVSDRGLQLAFLIALRAVGAVLLIFPMIGTMRFDVTVKALHRLKVPAKLIQMFMFTYRYIFVLLDELKKMTTAARARLFQGRSDFRTLKLTGNLAAMLLVRGLERTRGVYQAMVARGYDGSFRTLEEFTLSGGDILKASGVVSLAAGLALAGILL